MCPHGGSGSDDGRVHLTRDGGANWTDITPSGMPELGTVDEIELSVHRAGRAYIAVQRYRIDDFAPYIRPSWKLPGHAHRRACHAYDSISTTRKCT